MTKTMVRWLVAIAMVIVGVLHFVDPTPFVRIVPAVLPAKLWLVWISGAAEVAGGLGLLVPRTRRWAGYGLIALFVAVFPANINMAVNHIQMGAEPLPAWAPWARLPLQALFIAVVWWVSRDDERR